MKLRDIRKDLTCPFCKKKKVRIDHTEDKHANIKQADCTECGAKGPKVTTFKQHYKGISTHA